MESGRSGEIWLRTKSPIQLPTGWNMSFRPEFRRNRDAVEKSGCEQKKTIQLPTGWQPLNESSE